MAIKFLSLLGFQSKSRNEQPTPIAPTPPVPEVTAELSIKEEFHDAIAHTNAGWFRFDSDRSVLLASMTVTYDITELDYTYTIGKGLVNTPVRIVHTSAMIRLYRSSAVSLKTGEGNRCFVVCDRGGSFIDGDGVSATNRRFYSLEDEGVYLMTNYFLNKIIPYAFIEVSLILSNLTNEKITDITIPDETALKSLIPCY